MPSNTFLNLSKDKQKIIIEASIKEFSRVPLKDASINKIVKTANISRGSFYTYFNNIDDLYFYAIDSYKEKLYTLIEDTLDNNKGDLISSTLVIFDGIINFSCSNMKLFRNIFLNVNYSNGVESFVSGNCVDYRILEMLSKIDVSNLNIASSYDLFYIVDMIIGIIIRGLKDIFIDGKLVSLVLEKVENQLYILQRGILKEDK